MKGKTLSIDIKKKTTVERSYSNETTKKRPDPFSLLKNERTTIGGYGCLTVIIRHSQRSSLRDRTGSTPRDGRTSRETLGFGVDSEKKDRQDNNKLRRSHKDKVLDRGFIDYRSITTLTLAALRANNGDKNYYTGEYCH